MSEFQFMPFYWSDFLGDTTHLSGLEAGVYALLLGQMWLKRGWVPDDDAEIARMCRINKRTWLAMKPAIDPLLRHKEGRISQKRLLDEIRKAKRIAEKNRKKIENFRKAKKQANQADKSPPGHNNHNHNHNHIPPNGGDARMRARGPPDLSACFAEEARKLKRQENGHIIDGEYWHLETGDGSSEDARAGAAGEITSAKSH